MSIYSKSRGMSKCLTETLMEGQEHLLGLVGNGAEIAFELSTVWAGHLKELERSLPFVTYGDFQTQRKPQL